MKKVYQSFISILLVFSLLASMTLTSFDIVNIGLHFFLKNVRPYAVACIEA